MAKKGTSAKSDFIIKAKGTSTRILEASSNALKIEGTDKGVVTGKHYTGIHWDTVEVTMKPDGTAALNVKYMHMTNKGESIIGTGTATQEAPDRKGIAKVKGEGTTWTSAPRLSHLNGAKWVIEGDVNMPKDTFIGRGHFETG